MSISQSDPIVTLPNYKSHWIKTLYRGIQRDRWWPLVNHQRLPPSSHRTTAFRSSSFNEWNPLCSYYRMYMERCTRKIWNKIDGTSISSISMWEQSISEYIFWSFSARIRSQNRWSFTLFDRYEVYSRKKRGIIGFDGHKKIKGRISYNQHARGALP